MSKNLIGAICGSVAIISAGICSLGYALGNSNYPWWLVMVAGGIICAIVSMVSGINNEKNTEEKSKKLIGCICASISMISVFIFLAVMMLTKYENSWIIVFIGGIVSGVTYMLYNAVKKDKK